MKQPLDQWKILIMNEIIQPCVIFEDFAQQQVPGYSDSILDFIMRMPEFC